jgi:hypothetical protein
MGCWEEKATAIPPEVKLVSGLWENVVFQDLVWRASLFSLPCGYAESLQTGV